MRKFTLLLGLMLTLLVSGCNMGSSVAVVDIQKVFADSENGRKAKQYAATVQQVLQQNLNVIQEKLKAYPDEKQVQELLQIAYQQLQADLKKQQDEVARNSLVAMHNVVKEYQAEKEFDLIVNAANALQYSQAADITAEIVTRFDKMQILFPALPQVVNNPQLPEPRPAPAAENADEAKLVGDDKDKGKDEKKGK